MTLFYKEIESPVGKLRLVASANALVGLLWEEKDPNRVRLDGQKNARHHPILVQAERQLSEYFTGKRTQFELPLEPRGTEFQKKVWRSLRKIPFGKTKSYMEIARAIGLPRACRAVGGASGKNPLSIIVPCHRVVGANGALTGFGGGLETKAKLLALEARSSQSPMT
ncbi:MAG: methylated-DNA--[protein]-cysteine S-methyltransferase [Candidatus Binatia bacterium]